MPLKPKDKNREFGEKMTKYQSIALNRGYTASEANILARMMIAADNRQSLSTFTAAELNLYTRFNSL